MSDWAPPRCEHGHILLGCPHEDCAAQNEHLAEQERALAAHRDAMAEASYLAVCELLGVPPTGDRRT